MKDSRPATHGINGLQRQRFKGQWQACVIGLFAAALIGGTGVQAKQNRPGENSGPVFSFKCWYNS